MHKSNKGISLIVLVITIIVILILAISIVLTLGNNNPISNARKATFLSDIKNMNDELSMYISSKYLEDSDYDMKKLNANKNGTNGYLVIKDVLTSITSKYENLLEIQNGILIYAGNDSIEREWFDEYINTSEKSNVPIEWQENIYDIVDTVPIPKGFFVSDDNTENKKELGLVIKDYDGNEYVWVPVEYSNEEFDSKFTRVEWNVGGNALYYRVEPAIYNEYDEVSSYNNMVESIKKYKGFYIARYEAGDGDTTTPRTGVTTAHKVVSKPMSYVYNYIPWGNNTHGEISNQSGAVYLAENVSTYYNLKSVQSTLCYGIQWDCALKFIQTKYPNYPKNSLNKGWYYPNSGKNVHLTGEPVDSSIANKVVNIYDMAGNLYEWTMESYKGYNDRRILKGGCFEFNDGAEDPAGVSSDGPIASYEKRAGFRVTLYIK